MAESKSKSTKKKAVKAVSASKSTKPAKAALRKAVPAKKAAPSKRASVKVAPAKQAKAARPAIGVKAVAPELTAQEKAIREFAFDAARMLDDSHVTDIMLLDVRGKSDLTDYILLGSGTSDRQIRSVAAEISRLGEERDMVRMGSEEDGSAMWVVVDFVDVIVHLFEPATRSHYDIEMLWGDAPRLSWQRRSTKSKK